MGIKNPDRIYCPHCGYEGKKEDVFNPEKLLVPRRCSNCGQDYYYFWQVGSYYLSVKDKYDFWTYNRLQGVSDDFVGCPDAYQLRYSERVNQMLKDANPPIYYSNEVLHADRAFIEKHPDIFRRFTNNRVLRLCNPKIDFSAEMWVQPVEFFYQFQDSRTQDYNGLGTCLLTRTADDFFIFYRKPMEGGAYPNYFTTIGSGALRPEDLEKEAALGHYDLQTLLHVAALQKTNEELNVDLKMDNITTEILGFGIDNYRAGNLDFYVLNTLDRYQDELPVKSMDVMGALHARYEIEYVPRRNLVEFLRKSKNPQMLYLAFLFEKMENS